MEKLKITDEELSKLMKFPIVAETQRALASYDFIVYSDASAVYTDDYGGYASFTTSLPHNIALYDFGSGTNLDTNRAELLGGLGGIRRAYAVLKSKGLLDKNNKSTLLWRGDRQNLMEAVADKNQRKADGDHWNTFAFYEQYFTITGKWVSRDVGGLHETVDRLSAELRWATLEFARSQEIRKDVPHV